MILAFGLGLVVGGTLGVVAAALLVAAKERDCRCWYAYNCPVHAGVKK